MCFVCDLINPRPQTDYLEISPIILADSTVTVFGMVALVPPAQVVFGANGYRLSTAFYN